MKRAVITHLFVFLVGVVMVLSVQRVIMPSCFNTYNLLNPAFRCNETAPQGEWDYEPLRNQLSAMTSELKTSGNLSQISLYFRDLTNGPRFGIGEYDQFHPASLTKVPVLIAFLHEADNDPTLLDKKLSFSGSLNVNENVDESEETIQPNTPYTIRELQIGRAHV